MGMTGEDATLVSHYRAAVEDIPSPDLDQLINAAAKRQAAKRRFSRRARTALLVTVVVGLTVSSAWRTHQTKPNPIVSKSTGYGRIEGITRPYLMQVGSSEGSP
jgi:alkanesulfonate monooxygenase SsuD/methylene tetrahydromethanopterin reductase-like flavin-dependent oxidoreductase (luciferase family)